MCGKTHIKVDPDQKGSLGEPKEVKKAPAAPQDGPHWSRFTPKGVQKEPKDPPKAV